MYPFFETIRFTHGVAEQLSLHQSRVDTTLRDFGATNPIPLAAILSQHRPLPPPDGRVYKCRIQYDLQGAFHIGFEPYEVRTIRTVRWVDIGANQYPYKYTDRVWIQEALSQSGTDEVMLSADGVVRDASYANLVFFDGRQWFTPSTPLLRGTRRAALLAQGLIAEALIHIDDLSRFQQVKFINAMIRWEESPTLFL